METVQTKYHKLFKLLKKFLPLGLSKIIRNICTAILTPIIFSYKTGHFISSLKMIAVSKRGDPLPWYSYPCIYFLMQRSYQDKIVLEFGGGQSTFWWAKRAKHVVSFEGNKVWYDIIKEKMPSNVSLFYAPMEKSSMCIEAINNVLGSLPYRSFDVVIIDGLYRYDLIDVACQAVNAYGLIICDDSQGYGFYEGFQRRRYSRVDFFGNVPGVLMPHCTSIYFKTNTFIFHEEHTIPNVKNTY